MNPIPLLILVGPTASGKTEVAVPLAQALRAEIVSADSMLIYRGMDIGTAKPSPEIRQAVTHHLIDICDPWESFDTALFVQKAGTLIRDIHSRGKQTILVGGTALYIQSLLTGLFQGPAANWEIREKLLKKNLESLYQELRQVDPDSAGKISGNDQRRIVRALEVFYVTGTPISRQQQQWANPSGEYKPVFIGILWAKEVLHQRINKRVEEMLAKGLIAETEKLLSHPRPLSHTASQAIGYKEVIAAIRNPALSPHLLETLQRNTRHFAKRQMTWFRRFPVHWLHADSNTTMIGLAEQALQYWRSIATA